MIKIKIFWAKYKNIIPIFGILTICLIAFGLSVTSLIQKVKSQPPKDASANNSKESPANAYEISDQSLGLNFYMDKSFDRISQQELTQKNPYFVYGFKPSGVEGVACFVSQTKRTKAGYVSPEFLKDGTIAEVKKSNPSANLDSWEKIKAGDTEAAKLHISYKEGDNNFKQIEIVGTTDKLTTFAFCISPETLYNELYKNKFDIFFSSLKIK